MASLSRLRSIAASIDTALIACADDGAAEPLVDELIRFALPSLDRTGSRRLDGIVLLVTPQSISIHCPADTWASTLQPALDEVEEGCTDNLEVHAYVPDAAPVR